MTLEHPLGRLTVTSSGNLTLRQIEEALIKALERNDPQKVLKVLEDLNNVG
jgi:hypothetical protein